MQLLQWAVLQPHGPSKLAAILFPSPVRVASICIYPTGHRPFTQCPDVVALTEPASFYLDVFFNTIPTALSSEAAHRAPKNQLAPTSIAYAGGAMQYEVNMGPDHGTRLVIFKGEFENLSLAIYGDPVAEKPEIETYEPSKETTLSSISSSSWSNAAAMTKPAQLAEQLLSLLPVPRPLSLLIRLTFCLKPKDDDWDHPDFPFLYSDIESDEEAFDLETLVEGTSRPIREDVSEEALTQFASRVNDLLGSKASDEVYDIAKLLSISAPQGRLVSEVLLRELDITTIFDEHNLDESTLLCLFDAAANVEIARHFSENAIFKETLRKLEITDPTDTKRQMALQRLNTRMEGWKAFENALDGGTPDYSRIHAFLLDISSEEFSVGCWLESILNLDHFSTILGDAETMPSTEAPPLVLQGEEPATYADFVGFTRAMACVACICAVLAWADSDEKDECRERALGILVLWQNMDGYRELVNHLLLLRQMTKRLGWITEEKGAPRKSCVLAERLLVGMASDTQCFLRDDFSKAIISLSEPYSFIDSEERSEMEKLAKVARDGLQSAIDELAFTSQRPFSKRRLRVLRLALALLIRELEREDGEEEMVQEFWDKVSQGLVNKLVSILVDISDDLRSHFIVNSLPVIDSTLSESLLRTAHDCLYLLRCLLHNYPIHSRDLRNLTVSTYHLIATSERTAESSSTPLRSASLKIHTLCFDVLQDLVEPQPTGDTDTNVNADATLAVLRALLEHAPLPEEGWDPVQHIVGAWKILERLLQRSPTIDDDSRHWVATAFPRMLREVKTFFDLLEPSSRFAFLHLAAERDRGQSGIAELLVMECFKGLADTLRQSLTPDFREELVLFRQYAIFTNLRLLELLSTSKEDGWFLDYISKNHDLGAVLENYLSVFLEGSYVSPSFDTFIRAVLPSAESFDPGAQLNIVLCSLRVASRNLASGCGLPLDQINEALKAIPNEYLTTERLRNEIGRLLQAYASSSSSLLKPTASHLYDLFDWLVSKPNTKLPALVCISKQELSTLTSDLEPLLPDDQQQALQTTRTKLTFDDDELLTAPDTTLPSDAGVTVSLETIQDILSGVMPASFKFKGEPPSTPKGQKTPDILGVVISPPTAILRSPAATGLTKRYGGDSFREPRIGSTARLLNTSRMPSTHVDDFFGQSSSPEVVPIPLMESALTIGYQGLTGPGPGGL